MNTSRPFTFDRVVRILAGLAMLAGAVWMINKLRNVLLPFCLACLIAYLLEPLVELHRRRLRLKGRVIAVALTLLEVTVVIGLLWYFIMPSVLSEIDQIGELIKNSQTSNVAVPFVPENIAGPLRRWISSIDMTDILKSIQM
ncbi:AI-2E family transporter, partial [Paramuribaculum intestinale]